MLRRNAFLYVIFFLLQFLFSSQTLAQIDTVDLNQLEISSCRTSTVFSESSRIIQVITKAQIETAAASDIHDLLKFATGVDCRQRGVDGVQSDISIRGGTADQVLVLLNGIPLNDPQTGHHTLSLPVDIQSVQRIEILEGAGSIVYGPNAFTGAINIITENDEQNNLEFLLKAGEFTSYNGFISYAKQCGNVHSYGSVSKKISDGFMKNTDFNIGQAFFQSELNLKKASMSIFGGYTGKDFGANSFYSSKYPEQFEEIRTSFVGLKCNAEGLLKKQMNLYWRNNHDRFELFRGMENAASWYTGHNYHRTHVLGADLNFSFSSRFGKTAFGAALRNESILSNVLGVLLDNPVAVPGETGISFTKGSRRENLGFYLEHSNTMNRLTLSAGSYMNANSVYGWGWYPGMDLSFHWTEKLKWIASANKSMRIPTFTDLYYSSPTNISNPDLLPESCFSYETGIKYTPSGLNLQMSVFRREARNLIDWVKHPDSTKWEVKNITALNTSGAEISLYLNFKKLFGNKNIFINFLSFSYSYLFSSKAENEFISKYVMDYLKHKADLKLNHRIFKNISASWSAVMLDRNGTYIDFTSQMELDYKPVFLLNTSVQWKVSLLNFFLEADNLFDASYYDFGNIAMPGRWVSGGVKVEIDFRKNKQLSTV